MSPWPPHLYLSRPFPLLPDGTPDLSYRHALEQAHAVQQRGLAAILTLNHLAVRTGVPWAVLRFHVRRLVDPYHVFRIRKRSGGFRTICVGPWWLTRVQQWLAAHVLNRASVHPRSFAYAPGSSIVKCARMHCGCRWLVKIDIRRFFEAISELQVFRVFHHLGYQRLVSQELARICTRCPRRHPEAPSPPLHWSGNSERYSVIKDYRTPFIGFLPQGAPTSPMLSNLAMVDFDQEITEAADGAGVFYTRYSDDLVFSTSSPRFNRVDAVRMIDRIFAIMRTHGLRPNATKTVIAPPGARKVVLGLLVDRDRPRLSRELRSRLERLLHGAENPRGGALADYVRWRDFRTIQGFLNHLEGLLNFAWMVDPEYVGPLRERFERIPRPPE